MTPYRYSHGYQNNKEADYFIFHSVILRLSDCFSCHCSYRTWGDERARDTGNSFQQPKKHNKEVWKSRSVRGLTIFSTTSFIVAPFSTSLTIYIEPHLRDWISFHDLQQFNYFRKCYFSKVLESHILNKLYIGEHFPFILTKIHYFNIDLLVKVKN